MVWMKNVFFLYFYIIVWKKHTAPNSLSSILYSVRVLQGLRISLYDYPKVFQFLLLSMLSSTYFQRSLSCKSQNCLCHICTQKFKIFIIYKRKSVLRYCAVTKAAIHWNILQFFQKIIFFLLSCCELQKLSWTDIMGNGRDRPVWGQGLGERLTTGLS